MKMKNACLTAISLSSMLSKMVAYAAIILMLSSIILMLSSIPVGAQTRAQNSRRQVDGVLNSGWITDKFLRGAEITPEGLAQLAAMGFGTVIALRDDPDSSEAEACKRLGLAYYNFPMSNHQTPDAAVIDKVLQIIREADKPVYVHCAGGKHRTGTVCALYRMRVQGWSSRQAWKEEEEYGFGPPEEHPELFLFTYGDTPLAKKLPPQQGPINSKQRNVEDESASGKTNTTVTKPSQTDIAKSSSGDTAVSSAANPIPATPKAETVTAKTDKANVPAWLPAASPYLLPMDAVQRARTNGATGDLLRLNLEYDDKRSVPVWKVTFSSTTEYRMNALTGALLPSKSKTAEGLAILSPLEMTGRLLSFRKIIQIVESDTRGRVEGVEMKRIRGRNQTLFEVILVDGKTFFYDAATGKHIREF